MGFLFGAVQVKHPVHSVVTSLAIFIGAQLVDVCKFVQADNVLHILQATISGLFTATFFLFISHARPLETLSAQRPHPNIFSPYVILSLLGQFAIHLTFLVSAVRGAQAFMPEECIEPDSEFSPNLVNTVSYMSNMMIQVRCQTVKGFIM